MRKSTIFISSVLTTFALVILYGVVRAYQNNAAIKAAEIATQPIVTVNAPVPTDVPTAIPTAVTPEEAAKLAARVVGHDNLLSAESSSFNGVDAYLVTFTNNDMVYVGLDGQILSVQIAPLVVNAAPPSKNNNNNQQSNINNSNNNSQQSYDDHGSEGEHEEHDN
jgi:hypothetical protein